MAKTGISGQVKSLRIAILGPGAVGGFLAAVLVKAGHAVTCIARKESVPELAQKGITLESNTFGTFTVRPRAVAALDELVDILFITTKAYGLERALESIPVIAAENAVVIPLLNGIGHMDILRRRFGARVAAGSIGSFEAYVRDPGAVVHVSPSARVNLASDRDVPRERLQEIVEVLVGAGIPARVLQSENDVLWGKLVRLNALALVTAASGCMIREAVQDPKLKTDLASCIHETAAVARAHGVALDADDVLRGLSKLEIGETTSLARDVALGSEGELDAIAGAVIRAGARYGIPCPVTERLMEAVLARAARQKQNA